MTGSISAAIAERRPARGFDWLAHARELGPGFASWAAAYDANDSFPPENYRELKEASRGHSSCRSTCDWRRRRDLALQKVAKKREDPDVWYLPGEMENALIPGQMAVQAMIDLCADYTFAPDLATANAALIRKTVATQALQQAVEKALETVGGSGLFRNLGLERLVRDIHAAQFHPLQAKRRHRFTGRVVLGLEPVGKARASRPAAAYVRERENTRHDHLAARHGHLADQRHHRSIPGGFPR